MSSNYLHLDPQNTCSHPSTTKQENYDEEEVETYQLVGSLQADPLNGLISNESPLGKAVLDKKVGDKAYVKTESHKEFWVEILDIK